MDYNSEKEHENYKHPESRHPEATKSLYYVLFTRGS